MLKRQKVLLLMLNLAGRSVQRVELMKWSFLLRHESPSGGGDSFYDFVPYRFGPYSFGLVQELQGLFDVNYVLKDGKSWQINPELFDSIEDLSGPVRRDVRRVVSRFVPLPTRQLLDYVYSGYPEFTVNSERKPLRPRPTTDVAIYTVGYEGVSVDCLLNLLIQQGIEQFIDVRNNPSSRRYGFHKSTLISLTSMLHIKYFHFPELGIHSDKRQGIPVHGDRKALFDEYERSTLDTEEDAQLRISDLMRERPSVLVCLEADPLCCHRSRLANRIADLTDLPIIHLRPKQQ